jgi:chromate transporter
MRPSVREIFVGFLRIAITSFGGALPWARRVLVERRAWLSPGEFTDTISLCQFLPGAPVLNLAVVVGGRWRGAIGACAAMIGFVGVPILLSLAVGTLYLGGGEFGGIRGALAGIAAAAAGMSVSLALKLVAPVLRGGSSSRRATGIIAVTFTSVALMSLPLVWVVAVLAPLSIGLAWRAR